MIGQPLPRVDGVLKVTGRASYAAEPQVEGLLYGVVVPSPIARGRIVRLDAEAALSLPGVVAVYSHLHRPRQPWLKLKWKDQISPGGHPQRPLHDARIHHAMQPIALVVAESFELARHAALLLDIACAAEPHRTEPHGELARARAPGGLRAKLVKAPPARGDAAAALATAPVRIDEQYETPPEHHHPMEMHAATVIPHADGRYTVWDKTQGPQNAHGWLCRVSGIAKDKLTVLAPFVGGAFGSGLRPQYQTLLALWAAQALQRPVRVVLTRQQMPTVGHRPHTLHRIALGAAEDGKLRALVHEGVSETSRYEDFVDEMVRWSGQQYQCADVKLEQAVVPLDIVTPCDMRAPGAAPGVYAIECAIDELAHRLTIDPVQFRLLNYTETDPNHDGRPFSSKALRECLAQGAARIGWSRRRHEPRALREGHQLVGLGLACGAWDALQAPARARAVLHADGTLVVGSGTADIGTGTYTVMAQIAAEALGLPMERVRFELGDSGLPMAPIEGGSWTVASVGSAVQGACGKLCKELARLAARHEASPLKGLRPAQLALREGAVCVKADPARRIDAAELLRALGMEHLEVKAFVLPKLLTQRKYTRGAHSAVFAEVHVDEDLGTVDVRRVVSAIAGGRVLNPRTARSQIMGAVVGGIGMALHEEAVMDHALGRCINHDLAQYHVAANADVHEIDVLFVEEHDEIVNPLGAKGLGEIGIVGVAAAIANAVFNATGKRVRKLPITLDKLL